MWVLKDDYIGFLTYLSFVGVPLYVLGLFYFLQPLLACTIGLHVMFICGLRLDDFGDILTSIDN